MSIESQWLFLNSTDLHYIDKNRIEFSAQHITSPRQNNMPKNTIKTKEEENKTCQLGLLRKHSCQVKTASKELV